MKRLAYLVAALCTISFDSVHAFKIAPDQPVHETITTQSLTFLRQDVLQEVITGNRDADIIHITTIPGSSANHFDNCDFLGGVQRINSRYGDVLFALQVQPMAAAHIFGRIVHAAQDFYAHSNWVELGRQDLADSGTGPWLTGNPSFTGLFSGTYEQNEPKICEQLFGPGVVPTHDQMNKDKLGRAGFQEARTLAVRQTQHEWCRLLGLVRGAQGETGVDRILNAWTTDRNAALAVCPNVDVVLIIDSSGSMTSNDPANMRLAASRGYLVASLPGDSVGVVDFDDSTRIASSLQRLPENGSALASAIDTIDSSGGTDIGAGVQAGCDVLTAGSSGNIKKAAILLTDGQGSYSGQAGCFQNQNWPIYTFAFCAADDMLLQQIASSTGGEHRRIPTSDLVCEFQRVRAKIAGTTPGPCTAITVGPNSTQAFTVAVATNQAQATFSTSWPGSDVLMTLTSPSGRLINRQTTAQDVFHRNGPTFEVYSVTRPEAGNWGVTLFGLDVPEGGEAVSFVTTSIPSAVPPDVTPPAVVARAVPGSLWPPNNKLQTINVELGVSDDTDSQPVIELSAITCDDGCYSATDIADAMYGQDDRQFKLRATRTGTGSGRTYTIVYTIRDASGNVASGVTTVTVSHDQRSSRSER
jgi:hypothetical protein